jgi:hypothetical protein
MTSERDKPEDVPVRVDFLAWADKHIRSFDERDAAQAALERERTRRRERLEASGIAKAIMPEDIEMVVNDVFPEQTHALRLVKRWAYVHGSLNMRAFSWLAMTGLRGRGKTLAGAWLLALDDNLEGHFNAHSGLYVHAEVLRRARSDRKERPLFERACDARTLVVDELGTEGDERDPDDDSPKRMMSELVTRRAGLSTAWTLLLGNVAEDELVARYDERAIEKIGQRGRFVVCEGPNMRRPLVLEEMGGK